MIRAIDAIIQWLPAGAEAPGFGMHSSAAGPARLDPAVNQTAANSMTSTAGTMTIIRLGIDPSIAVEQCPPALESIHPAV